MPGIGAQARAAFLRVRPTAHGAWKLEDGFRRGRMFHVKRCAWSWIAQVPEWSLASPVGVHQPKMGKLRAFRGTAHEAGAGLAPERRCLVG
jgi:hypothetical protein